MSNVAIRVENLSKRYVINHQRASGDGLRHALQDKLTAPYRALRAKFGQRKAESGNDSAFNSQLSAFPPASEEFWALKDVSFEIKRGEVVGIIGRNGAGKSTLLKILSRITEPTSGRITIEGRVASLLEVGTGFHPELTGRENIFLNGAILGMSRSEIRSKFDEIVAFAEVERFLDTPVKRYSSGMYVRLAFAVAAHLEPDILVVDEVLAVGDAQFQKKCLGKLQDVARDQGRAVLFVSHQMEAIHRLTQQCIWLSTGKIERTGPTRTVVSDYLASQSAVTETLDSFRERIAKRLIQVESLWVENAQGVRVTSIQQGETFYACLRINSTSEMSVNIGLVIENETQQALFATHLSDSHVLPLIDTDTTFRVLIEPPVLRSGNYSVSAAVFSADGRKFFDVVLHYPLITVSGSARVDFPSDNRWGNLYFKLNWEIAHQHAQKFN